LERRDPASCRNEWTARRPVTRYDSGATMAQRSYANPALSKLFEPYHLGHLERPNRIIMAPLTQQSCRPRECANFAHCEILRATCIRRTDFGGHAGCAGGGKALGQHWESIRISASASAVVEGATGSERNSANRSTMDPCAQTSAARRPALSQAGGRISSLRQGVPRQSGSGRPLACRRSAQRPRQVDVLRRWRKRLYRLPIFGVGLLGSGRSLALCAVPTCVACSFA
jgi:hypothetical protein